MTVRISYSPVEAAKVLGVSRAFMYVLLARREIPARKIGTRTLIADADLSGDAGIKVALIMPAMDDRVGKPDIIQFVKLLIAHANIATQIPSAERLNLDDAILLNIR